MQELLDQAALEEGLGNVAAAEEKFTQAENLCKVIGQGSLGTLLLRAERGLFRWRKQDITGAQEDLELALEPMREALADDPRIPEIEDALGSIYARLGRLEEGITLLRRAAHADSSAIEQLLTVGSDRVRRKTLDRMRQRVEKLILLLARLPDLDPQQLMIGYTLVLRRKGMNTTIERLHRRFGIAAENDPVALRLREIRAQLGEVALTAFMAGQPRQDAAVVRNLLAERERLEYSVTMGMDPLRLRVLLEHEDTMSVAMQIPKGSCLIDYLRVRTEAGANAGDPVATKPTTKDASGLSDDDQDRYVAFVIRAGSPFPQVLRDLGPARKIDELVGRFRADVERCGGGSSDNRWTASGRQLREQIFDPLLSHIGDTRRVIICPDAALSLVPFEALPAADGRNLIDGYQFSYVASGRDAVYFAAESSEGLSQPPLVIGDPEFNLRADGQSTAPKRSDPFAPLPATEAEARDVAAMLGVEPLLGAAATETALVNYKWPRILHIATHGYYFPSRSLPPSAEWLRDEPLLCGGLAFASANTAMRGEPLTDDIGNGIVTAEEVLRMNLLQTELVVLSSCVSGLGDVSDPGEGVRGLRNSFFGAGAWSAIMSLWKVPDATTRELMFDFYRRLLGGDARVTALRDAQLALKHKRPEPLFWAGFICQGVPGKLGRKAMDEQIA